MTIGISELDRMARACITDEARRSEHLAALHQQIVISTGAAGSGEMEESFGWDCRYRLVLIRCHFAGMTGLAPFQVTLDSVLGEEYDTHLVRIPQAGTGRDVNWRAPAGELTEPSPWTFQPGDRIRLFWPNPAPGSVGWGVEVGLACATEM